MSLKSKLFTSAIVFTMVLSLVAVPASAQTTAELNAQIAQLMAMIAQLQGQAGSTSTSGASMMFTTDLTVGSKGAEVSALQSFLVSKGFLTMPAGVAMGYFGSLTKSALAAYQASVGISPAAGYFGPITRAKVNASGSTTGSTGGTVTCPAGYTCTSTGGGTTTGGITTPGAEGTLTVTSNNSGLVSTVYEGDSMVGIYGFSVEAKNSDIALQRVKVDLGASTKIYNKGYKKIYITDGSNVLASSDLNSSTVVKDGSEYYITVTGFNYVVPKNTKKQLTVKMDVMSSIDSTDMDGSGSDDLDNISITIPANGVRGVDGAGIDQYGPASALTGRSTSFSSTLSDSATLKLSLNSSSPKRQDVVAASGANENELDKLTTLVFDVKAEKDDVTLTDMRVGVVNSGSTSGAATVQTAYLYDGSTEIDNASVSAGVASFTDIDYVISKDTTKTLTVKIDVRNADGTLENITTQASTTVAADLVAENSNGDSVTVSGSAIGYAIGIRNVGPEVSLVSKSVTTNGAPQTGGSSNISTSSLTATFNVKVKAVGGDLMFGTAASGTPMFASSTTGFKVYRNGAYDALLSSVATSTSYATPSGVTTSGLSNSFTLSEGNEVTIPVTFQITGRNVAGVSLTSGLYAVGLEGVQYVSSAGAGTINFMAGETDWRTSDVSFP